MEDSQINNRWTHWNEIVPGYAIKCRIVKVSDKWWRKLLKCTHLVLNEDMSKEWIMEGRLIPFND